MLSVKFHQDLIKLLNEHTIDSLAGVSDALVADYIVDCIHNLQRINRAVRAHAVINSYTKIEDGDK
jgi:hypothetical protein